MRLEKLSLDSRLHMPPVAQFLGGNTLGGLKLENPAYRTIMGRLYAETWCAHPRVWEMHGINGQFETVVIDGKPRNGIPATKHCVAQAARARVLAEMLGLPRLLIKTLEAGVLLTDSYKFREWRYMNEECENGPCWNCYATAQRQAKWSWAKSGLFGSGYLDGSEVIEFAGSVAHETLLMMELICADARDGNIDDRMIAKLIAHYVDDISRDHDWVTEAADGENVLDLRMKRNAANPTYARLNEEGRMRLLEEAVEFGFTGLFSGGETTYEAQARVGHMVEALLTRLLTERFASMSMQVVIDPLNLPVIIDNEVMRRIGLAYQDLRRGGVNALRSRPILSRV